ncbi:MAG: ATP cone domain-containing protein [bacterium]|nr:ATP cone domain-containing protein [bacterium]
MIDAENNFLFPKETIAELTVPKLMFRRIQKRDGTLVDFDKNKITTAIFKAAQSVGGKDYALADSLADRVILYLSRTYPDGLLNVEQVQDAIEKVLIEHGHAQTAKAFILYRAARQRHRQIQLTQSTSSAQASLVSQELQVRTSDEEIIAWNRQRIIDALVRETQLDIQVATKISKEVELQIIESNLRIITAGLIRELVNAKLLEYGLEKERRMHARLGLPLYDFERLLLSQPIPADNTLSQTVLRAIERQYALAKVFSTEVVDAHAQGILYLHNLDEIVRGYELRFVLPETDLQFNRLCTLNLAAQFRVQVPLAKFAECLPQLTQPLFSSCNWEVLITEQDMCADGSQALLDAIEYWILERKAEFSQEQTSTCPVPKLYFRLLNDSQSISPEWVLHKVTLNLPNIAYQAVKAESEPYLFQLIQTRLHLIIQAHLQKQVFLNRVYGARLRELLTSIAETVPQVTYAIGLLGLNELVESFYGAQLHQSEPARTLAGQILAYLSAQCQQLSQTYNLVLRLEPTEIPEIAYRFAKLDLEREPILATPVVKRKPTNGGVYYTVGAQFTEFTSHELFFRIIAESSFHRYLNQQAAVTIPVSILAEYNGLSSLLRKVLQETPCRLVRITK